MGPEARHGRAEPAMQWVYGIHPVTELLQSRGSEVDRIFVARGRHAGLGRLLRLARESGIPVSHLEREALARKVGKRSLSQGVAAQVAPMPYADSEELCTAAAADPSAVLVLADRVVDPRNLGAIIRTAAAGGARGVLLSSEGTVGITPVVVKASAGAIERIPVGRVAKPARRIESLRKAGFQAVALDPGGVKTWDRADFSGRILLVAGGEGRGPRPGVVRACDHRLAIPLAAGVESLNVAVALGVLLFEAVRQRRVDRSGP